MDKIKYKYIGLFISYLNLLNTLKIIRKPSVIIWRLYKFLFINSFISQSSHKTLLFSTALQKTQNNAISGQA